MDVMFAHFNFRRLGSSNSQEGCLNYLRSNTFDLSTVHTSSATSLPKALKRVHEIFDKPTFMKHINSSDVKQGMIGDCWFIASLSALANVEDGIKKLCVEYDIRVGVILEALSKDGLFKLRT
ncbi:hypothetical protein BX600DRAFT_441768 [Xylariales sp. PMI_506]|nr:hypothetical protein BX600DRAFT_441768 [Xylariales sp. PMI_506]